MTGCRYVWRNRSWSVYRCHVCIWPFRGRLSTVRRPYISKYKRCFLRDSFCHPTAHPLASIVVFWQTIQVPQFMASEKQTCNFLSWRTLYCHRYKYRTNLTKLNLITRQLRNVDSSQIMIRKINRVKLIWMWRGPASVGPSRTSIYT